MNREGIIGYDIYIFRLLTHALTALSKGLCHISLCHISLNQSTFFGIHWTIARWRYITTTTRILQIVVFLWKLALLFFWTLAGLANLNVKAKTKWILLVVVKWSITNHSLLLALELNVADITYYNNKVTAQCQAIVSKVLYLKLHTKQMSFEKPFR